MSSFHIRDGRIGDAAPLAELAQRVFVQTFSGDPEHKPADLALHLAGALGAETIARELADPRTPYFIAEAGGAMIGYMKLEFGDAPPCVTGPRPMELARLYVDFDWHRSGVAHAFMQLAVDFARERGYRTMWLGVWHRNIRAQRFYRKWGFEHVGRHPYLFGTDQQTDEVFARPI